ncbi:MAG: phosphoribosylglycinamide synthetase [Pseudomonadota bacterium]
MDLRLKLTETDRDRVRVMLLAKHALGDGTLDATDGLHAVYHHELRRTLETIVPNLSVGTRYDDLFDPAAHDFLFTMLNRGGFKNSEMFGPLFAMWRGVPHLGASPILRGIGDDKHLAKLCARSRGVATPDSAIYRNGGVAQDRPAFADGPMMVKPNASSASWGVKKCEDWPAAQAHMAALMSGDGKHDVIVEHFVDGIEIAVPVVPSADGGPACLPVMIYDGEDVRLRTYQEKRFRESDTEWRVCDDSTISERVLADVARMMPDIWPFDFGRFEFKYSPETGALHFIELNMSCNLWSKKTVSNSWRSLGYAHQDLIETILAGSMLRQGVIETVLSGEAA